MTLPLISTVDLLPRHVPCWCEPCDRFSAEVWLISPTGEAITKMCVEHAKACLTSLYVYNSGWTTAPIYHDDEDQTITKVRT